MSIEQYAVFIYHVPNDGYLDEIYGIYDSNRDGFLTLEDFLNLSLWLCMERTQYVWRLLHQHHKRPDLREKVDIARQQSDKKSSISYIFQSNKAYLDVLYSLLDSENEEVAYTALKLLNRLPTHLQVFRDLVMLKGIRGIDDPQQRDWDSLISLKSKYKFLYVLNIVEYLMYYNENVSKILLLDDLKLSEYQNNWFEDFINYGGLDHFNRVFGLFKPDESNISTQLYKRILSFAKNINKKLSRIQNFSVFCVNPAFLKVGT